MNEFIRNKNADEIYKYFKAKQNRSEYEEDKHCKMLINVMLDKDKGRVSSFCVEAMISEAAFYRWIEAHPLFRDLYYFSKMVARENWELEGQRIKSTEYPMGTINHELEVWKLTGWTRFGISKYSRLKINMNPEDSPIKHYAQIIKQAAEGDFTAAEFKQLMESVNVGLNIHEKLELQKQIDELKSDLATMAANTNVQNPFTNKGIAQKD